MTAQGEGRRLVWMEAATFAGVLYDHRSYTDRDGSVWFFEDTISAEDGTWHMSSSSDCYLNSLADVVLHWGPLRPYSRRRHDWLLEEATEDRRSRKERTGDQMP